MLQEKFNEIWNSLEPKPHQRTYDFLWVIDEVEKIKPKTIIEIGTATGGSLKYWEQILLESGNISSDCLLIGIESNPGLIPTWDWKNSKVKVYIVHGDSSDVDIVERVKQILEGRMADFIFIDGGHRLSVPEKDFNYYSEFVRDDGIICIADLGEPCPGHVLLQLPEVREVDPTIGMAIWRKQHGNIKVKLCDNKGESTGEAYTKVLDIFRYRVPNPP